MKKSDNSINSIIEVVFPIVGAVKHIKKATRKVEQFEVDDGYLSEEAPSRIRSFLVALVYLLMQIGAIYLHYTCKNKLGLGVIPAFICPWCYFVWYAFTKDGCLPKGSITPP